MIHRSLESFHSKTSRPGMPTFYCIWPCEKCSYCNVLSTRKCRNCSETMRDAEQPLYLEDKNLLLEHNQRILATCSTTEKEHPYFKVADGFHLVSEKANYETASDKAIEQLLEFRIKSDALHRGLQIRSGEEIVEEKHPPSTNLVSAYEFESPHESSCVKNLFTSLTTKGTGQLSDHGQEKYTSKMDLMKEQGNDTNLSLDTEFEMYRKLSEMSLQQASGDCFHELEKRTLHHCIPEYKDSATSEALDVEPISCYHSVNSTASHDISDFVDYSRYGEISPKIQSPTAYPSIPLESIQFAHYSDPVEDIDETLFLSAVTSTQKSFVLENNGISSSESAEKPDGAQLVEFSDGNKAVFSDSSTEVLNGNKFEQANHNSYLQTAVLLENINQSAQCFPYQTAEFAKDQFACRTSTEIENFNQAPLEALNEIGSISPVLQNQGNQNQNNRVSRSVDSNQGFGKSRELLDNSDQLNLFDDSFVSAVGGSITGVMVAEQYTNVTVQTNYAFGSPDIDGGNNKSTGCVYQTPDLTPSGNASIFQRTCIDTQLKRDCFSNKGTNNLIATVNQIVDASADFRADFTTEKATTAMVSVIDRANNTDIILMSKNRPTLGQSKTYETVACNTKWSIADSTMKQQGTQTDMVGTMDKCTNTVSQTTDCNSDEKELDNNKCKTKLRKVLGELDQLKKKCKRTELQQQRPVYLTVSEDGNYSSDCCGYMKQRALKAELQFLKMQYLMCRQHCWRVHSVYIENNISGDSGFPRLEDGTDNGTALSSVLQGLKNNYEGMKQKVLEGISLDSLPLLSVELNLPYGTFVPAMLGEKSPSLHQSNSNYSNEVAFNVEPSCEDLFRKHHGDDDKVEKPSEELHSELYQHMPDKAEGVCEEFVTQATANDLEVTDDWFDAEETFTSSGGLDCMEGKMNSHFEAVTATDVQRSIEYVHDDRSVEREIAQTSYIYVDGLPRIITEVELRMLFQKYQVSGIWLCNLHSDYRCGVLRVASPNFAKIAVDEMNGREYHGKSIKVHMAKISGDRMLFVLKNHTQLPLKGQHLIQDHVTKDTKFKVDSQEEFYSASTKILNAGSQKMSGRKYKQMQCLQNTTTATGTFIPPNSANLSSFNKLMKTLLELYPEANRSEIFCND
ncbi:RNA-binding protein 44 isoform X3 [Leucoraja erinacea]|uniref:RNA-binding protein 44 isoform X3 n=1 Tax=Leucoraja erinaceus TaxID=7782 RepID=UPI0024581674|nr:RNA-binding protein 44 isoform X3 [Leucoraja erinacea]XP_055494231.1 RNA-binding protein 44 isoform X3 [Leucoraja erinacea]